MKILVTGGLGLIGHNVVHRLEKQGHEVVIVDNQTTYGIIPESELQYLLQERKNKIVRSEIIISDICNFVQMSDIIKKNQFDCIIHMASFPRQKVVNVNPMVGSRVMVEGLLNLLEIAHTNSVKKFVYISSSMVYGNFNHTIKEQEQCNPIGQYGIMKLAGEDLVKDYHRRGCFNYTIIRPSAVYGPLDVEDRVISKFVLTAMRGGQLKVKGENEMLDFTYVADAADGIVAAVNSNEANNKTYNITKGASTTLLQAAQLAIKIVGKGHLEVEEKDEDFPSRAALDITAARTDFGYDPKVTVEQGFVEYFNWLKSSPYWTKQINTL